MCFRPPPKHRRKGSKSKDEPEDITSMRIHCPLQGSHPRNSHLPPHVIARTKHTSNKNLDSEPPTTSFFPMYATASPPWLSGQYDPYSQDPYAPTPGSLPSYPLWPSPYYAPPTPLNAPDKEKEKEQEKEKDTPKDPSFLAWEKDKSEIHAHHLAEQALTRQSELEKRKERELNEKVEARLEFRENLRKRFNPGPSASEVAQKEWEKRERERRVEDERRREEEELGRLRREEGERKRREEMEGVVNGVKGVLLGKVEELERLIREKERREEKEEAKRGGREEGIREERERRGRQKNRTRSTRSGSSGERSRSWSRHRTTRGRNHAAGGAIGYPYGNGYGYVNGTIDPASLQYGGGVGYANQLLIHPTPNFNTVQKNPTVPFTNTSTYPYNDLLHTSQFESTARGISGKLNDLEQGQQTVLKRFGSLDTKLDNMDERSTRNFRDLNDTLRGLKVSGSGGSGRVGHGQNGIWVSTN
ncbi:hypothetical protein BKA65DRAFT_581542 [Rhexocercosporidium sp. MPI-PUGE-AT-0058]|nr:hypothetical protein BKA65DRAFT_581542 [Rhexocercosporidium sp. MPI-PUGE-AT-0058]